jgi:hypothetical protein
MRSLPIALVALLAPLGCGPAGPLHGALDGPSMGSVQGSPVLPPPEGAPARLLSLCQPSHMVPGAPASWTVSGAAPFQTVHFGMGTRIRHEALCPAMLDGTCVDLRNAWYLGSQTADAEGVATFVIDVPPHASVGLVTHAQAVVAGGASAITTGSVVPDHGSEGQCGSADVCDTAMCCELDVDADGLCDEVDRCPELPGELLDCEERCVDAGWLGDGVCDPSLDCGEHGRDLGDCAPCDDADTDGLCDAEDACPVHIGEATDCLGHCVHGSWIGDGICDEELDCARAAWDGGDCAGLGVPTAPEVGITPHAPSALDDLICRVEREATDPDSAELIHTVAWERDGVPLTDEVVSTRRLGDTVPADHTAPGSVFTCRVVASDGVHEGPAGTAEVTVRAPWATGLDVQNQHSCLLDDARRLRCWGHDGAGRVSEVGTDISYGAVGLADKFSCGLRWEDGGLECWGAVPAEVPEAAGWRVLDGYANAMCALDEAGSVHCFGSGGQVGATPAGVFQQIDVGTDFACGVRRDETLECWGAEILGRTTPPDGAFASVSAGHTHACGVNAAGLVRCWGGNDHGKAATAHLVGTFEAVAAGLQHTCAIRAGGEAVCWGRAEGGRLEAPAGVHFEQLSAAQHSCGITDAGAVRCWGDNADGEAPDVAYEPGL